MDTCSYIRLMKAVGIKNLKNRLSEYVRLAASGEVILVTDRDRVVARLGPVGEEDHRKVQELPEEAVRRGWLTPAVDRQAPLPSPKPAALLRELLKDLGGIREDR